MRIENLLEYINDYEPQYKELILRAYAFAYNVHKGVKRKSGEDYIIHPIAVACILAEMKADADTIAAGLLHDVIEDGANITKELIAEEFNPTIALLVDGVTNIKKIDFNNDKKLANAETSRKIIESVTKDIRIMIIKLADRLHNMRTMEYQSPEKQLEKSKETLDFYVPLAEHIGEYTFKQELEDLSFLYLDPDNFYRIKSMREEMIEKYRKSLDVTILETAQILNKNNIPFEIKLKIKNIRGLYNRLKMYDSLDDVHDLFIIKFILSDIDKCYWLMSELEKFYDVLENHRRDYIKHPKDNLYSSLHTSVYNDDGRIIQFQIKTKEMYMINSYGLPAYWALMSLNNPAERMQRDVRNFAIFRKVERLIKSNLPTDEFIDEVKDDILSKQISVYSTDCRKIEMPLGSTALDYAIKEFGTAYYTISANVNGKRVNLDYQLSDGDVINIYRQENLYGPPIDYSNMCNTQLGKRRILAKNKKGI